MTVIKKLTAALLACIITVGGITVYAEDDSTADSGVAIIEVSDKPETEIVPENNPETEIIPEDKPETGIIDTEEENNQPESSVDLSDIDYTPIDLSEYTRWDGKTPMTAGTNYYIKGTVKLKKNFTIPEGSRLVITPGANVTVYKGKYLKIKGSLVTEPKSTLTLSGTATVYKGASAEIYGKLNATKSSKVKISGEYVVRNTASCTYSGIVNIYKEGMYLNYGTSALTKNAAMTVTGDFQTPEGGKLVIRGQFAVSINGRASFSGGFYLYGESINSGVFIFEKSVRYYKTKSSRFAASKSSRIIDYRYYKPNSGSSGGSSSTDTGIKGIDVSYAQGAIDWASVKQAGVEFAILRASRGYVSEKKPMAEDVTFQYNVTQATAMGINVGVYHYLYATTVEEAVEEARFFLKTIEPYNITYPVVLDVEEQYQADLGKDKITAICKAFLDEIEGAGYYAMLYSNKAWLTNYLDMSVLNRYDVWLAQWNTVPTYLGHFGMWQYSSKGIVSGIGGYVDLNLSYKDYAKIIREGGFNNLKNDIILI